MGQTSNAAAGQVDRPRALDVRPEGVPAELRERHQWLLWRYERRDGHWTKPPYTTAGSPSSSTDPSTWTTFERALDAYRAGGGWDGIGYAHLSEEQLTGIDLDKCRDPASGAINPEDAAIVADLDTYAEVSPSAEGVRLF